MAEPFEILTERSCLRVSGEAAEHFLDNLITCQTVGLNSSDARFGALLSPQGKILFDFFLIKTADAFLIDTVESLADDLLKRLTFYKLRAKVEIERLAEFQVASFYGETPDGTELYITDPRNQALGKRAYGQFKSTSRSNMTYNDLRVRLGIAQGGLDFDYGDAYPHETLMDQFGGVDFKKGCYVGQEVVSRMQHRGTTKKRIIKVAAEAQMPTPKSPILADDKPAGTLGTISGTNGLALLRLDRAAKANALTVEGVSIRPVIQDWVSFGLPEVN